VTGFVRDALAVLVLIALIGFSSQALPSQTPSFEVASVKQNNDRSVRPALRYTPTGVDFAGVPVGGEFLNGPVWARFCRIRFFCDKNVNEIGRAGEK
jgi:hypothetical protein